jgi:hypothetical protein
MLDPLASNASVREDANVHQTVAKHIAIWMPFNQPLTITFNAPLRAAHENAAGVSANENRSDISAPTWMVPCRSNSTAGSKRPQREPINESSFTMT